MVRAGTAVVAERIETRFRRAGGRERLQTELRQLATDVVGHCEHDELDQETKELLRRVTDAAVAASFEPLVARFTAELSRGVAGLPEPVRDRLLQAERRRLLGWD